jgi:hypothetical protein
MPPPAVILTPGAQPYMVATTPLFIEADRVARLVYSTYASFLPIQAGQAFGLYAGLTALPPGIQSPAPLLLLWDTAPALWTQLLASTTAAGTIVVETGNAPLTSAVLAALPFSAPPSILIRLRPSRVTTPRSRSRTRRRGS